MLTILLLLLGMAASSLNSPAHSQEQDLGINEFSQSIPRAKDIEGNVLSSIAVGKMIILSVSNVNSGYSTQPYVAIIEVRNTQGVTVLLEFQFGALEPLGRTETGISWVPPEQGAYQIRTFLLTNLSQPEILSSIETGNIEVEVD